MIPNIDQLTVIAQMKEGDLSETPYPVVLHALAVNRRTAVLTIERKPLKKKIVLEDGVPVDCQSNLLQDTLGKFMVSRGKLTEEQSQLSLSKSVTSGAPLPDVIVSEGWVTASELYKILQQNLAKKLLDGFTWRSGNFRISSKVAPVDSPLKVKTPQLIITGITKLVPDEVIEEEMRSLLDNPLFLNPRPPVSIPDVRVTPEHQKLVALLQEEREGCRLEELVKTSRMPREKVLRLLYSLAVLGIVVPEAWLPKESLMASPDLDFVLPSVEEPQTAPFPKARGDVEALRNQLMEIYLRYRKLDAFDLLGISEESPRDLIEESYISFCERFAPWSFMQDGLSDLVDKAREVFLAGARAFGELSDPESRNSLVARRQNLLTDRTNKFDREQFLIKSELLDAEKQFEKGKVFMEAGRYKEALEQLQFAHDCDPQNSLYRAELAYCGYLFEPSVRAQDALKELNETLRIDPECGLATYYLGMIHSALDNHLEAEAYFQKAIKLLAPDRRPIDALKWLNASRQKKKKRKLF